MNSMERVLTTLSHREPDRVPLFLLLSMQGAMEVGERLDRYYDDPAAVAEGQLRLQRKYGHDCLYTFHYASIEYEAFGGHSIFREDGPANAGAPVIRSVADIETLQAPRVKDSPGLQRVLEATRRLHARVKGEIPIIGVVISPFSMPVMQMGFDHYLDLLTGDRSSFERLMAVNMAFASEWARAQLEAGATALCYFDPVSSPTIIPRKLYAETGWPIARTIIREVIQGPFALHFASGRALPVADLVAQTGAVALGATCDESLAELKQAFRGKVSVVGNLNGVEMRTWSPERAAEETRACLRAAARGGGYILADSHGEIPWQVPSEVLLAIAATAREEGRYPIP